MQSDLDEERRAQLIEEYGLIDDTGEWGEIIEDGISADGVNPDAIEIANPVDSSLSALSRSEKKLHAMKLRLGGASYAQIGEALGYTGSWARKLVLSGMEHDLQDTAKDLRLMHTQRLDALLHGVWPRAIKGDLPALDRALAILRDIERLHGLASATKVEHSHSQKETIIIAEGTREEYLAALRASAGMQSVGKATIGADEDADEEADDDDIAEADIVE